MTRNLVLLCCLTVAATLFYAPRAEAVTVTYSTISGTGFQYTQNGVRHRTYYNNFSSTGHHHSNSGDYIWVHASCCSNRMRIDFPGSNFTLDSITRRRSGTATWTAYNAGGSSIGSVTVTGSSGVYNFPASWTNLSRVDIVISSGQPGWDNLEVNTCTSVTAEAGGPYSVAEGSSVTLSGSGVGASTVTYAWDFDSNGSGPYNDATGASPSLNTATLGWDGTSSHTIGVQTTCGSATNTDTATVNVSNVAPTVTATIPSTGTEDVAVAFSVTATDPGPDTLTYTWNFGDGSPTVTGTSVSHTYADGGTYNVTVTVGDGETTSVASGSIAISNVAPTFTIAATSGNEGSPVSFTGPTTTNNGDTFVSWSWSFGDGSTSTAQNPTHSYGDNGSFTVSLTATDDDGLSGTASNTSTIANVNPVAGAIVGPTTGNEAQVLSWSTSVTDAGSLDTHTYSWDFGDNTVAGTGSSVSHAYTNDGTYTITVTVTDDDGGTDSNSITVVISNTPPSVTALSGPVTGDEGSTLSFAGTATDASPVDQANLTWSWDWGDSTPAGIGAAPSHAWDDEGTYTVTATVTDSGGLSDSDTYTVTINNVAPTITTNPALVASENVQYSYQANSTDPGADVANWSLSPSSPATATVDASGLVTWTPDFTEVGPNVFTITVDDGDGGTDVQVWTVVVGFEDLDNDGMADTWETDNGLDPTDPSDAALDPDGDGLTNLDEFLNGQDPNVSDLPDPPVLVWPIQGEEVDDPRPTLEWLDAVDPNGDLLTYEVEVYEDSTMTTLVTSAVDLDTLTWLVDVLLANENGTYYWRVRAHDGWGYSLWADLEDFFLNEFNEPPEPPTAIFPVDGEETTLTPIVDMVEGPDPDNDAVGHTIRLWNADGSELLSEAWMAPGARNVNWPVNVPLEEDTWYLWDAQAEDEHGLQSDWIEPEPFFSTGENAPPLDVFWTAPDDGSYVESASPVMLYTLSEDPEGRDVDYEIDLDTADTFDSGDLVSFVQVEADNGVLDLEADGTALAENSWWNARVRAIDTDQGTSAWDTIRFFVRGDNDAPPTPVLVSPEDGATLTTRTPVLAVAHVDDPEEDLVIYEILVTTDLDGTDIITAGNGLLGSAGPEGTADQTSWQVDVNLTGPVYWTARAVDERGAASAWAEPWMLTLDTGEPEGPSLDDILTGGCAACSGEASLASADNPAGFLAIALMLLVPAVRRRR